MKKLLIGAAMLAAVFAFTGCLQDMGKGGTEGGKFDKTMTVDGTKKDLEKTYRRYFKELSTSKEVPAIETTVTILKDDSILKGDEDKPAVVGLAFDVHREEKLVGKEKVNFFDFVLVGFKPSDGYYYVERYVDVSEKNANGGADDTGFDTDEGTVGTTRDAVLHEGKGTWSKSSIELSEDEEGNTYAVVKVTQEEAGTYVVYINDTKVASYKGTVFGKEAKPIANGVTTKKDKDTFADATKFAVGGAGVYANCPKGSKLKVNFKSNQKTTYGLFIDEE